MATELDIARNIRAIEKTKCDLLENVSYLFLNMLADEANRLDYAADKRLNIISDIIITAYCLAEKLGISYQDLDTRIVNRLKLDVLDDTPAWPPALLKHFSL